MKDILVTLENFEAQTVIKKQPLPYFSDSMVSQWKRFHARAKNKFIKHLFCF